MRKEIKRKKEKLGKRRKKARWEKESSKDKWRDKGMKNIRQKEKEIRTQ